MTSEETDNQPLVSKHLLEIETFRRVELERALSQTMNRLREYKQRLHNLASEHSGCASSYRACYSLVLQNQRWILDHSRDTLKLEMQIESMQNDSTVTAPETVLPVGICTENVRTTCAHCPQILDMTTARARRMNVQGKRFSKLPRPRDDVDVHDNGENIIAKGCYPASPRHTRQENEDRATLIV